jgi:hypothetical protein
VPFILVEQFRADIDGMHVAHGAALPRLLTNRPENGEEDRSEDRDDRDDDEQFDKGKGARGPFARRKPSIHDILRECVHTYMTGRGRQENYR